MKDLLLCCYFLAFLEFREIKSNDLIVIPQIFSGMLRSLLICRNFSNMTVVLSSRYMLEAYFKDAHNVGDS